jgi:hypothetical protein
MRTMAKVLAKHRRTCEVYLDDILIHSRSTMEKHHQLVEEILSTLQSDNWRLAANKCIWGVWAVQFVRYIVDHEGIYMEPGKGQVVSNWPTPTCVRHIRKFLGLTGFYRRFVDHYVAIAKPLIDAINKTLAGGTKQFDWTPELEKVFNAGKQA